MKFWNRFSSMKNEEVRIAHNAYESHGLDLYAVILLIGDYDLSEPDKTHKKVILVNPQECYRKIWLTRLAREWRGTGHFEWEVILAGCFIQLVIDAVENNCSEVEITKLFNRDFYASHYRVFTKRRIYNHIINSFDIIENTTEILKLRFRI